MRTPLAAVLLALGVLGACARTPAPAPEPAGPPPPGVLTFGAVSLSPADEYAVLRPFVDELARRLHDIGIGRGEVVLVGSVGEMVERLRSGQIDLYLDSPIPVAVACRLSGAEPLLQRLKQGVSEYHGSLVVRRAADIRTLDDLRGRMIAFSEPYSTSGHLLPKATLLSRGYTLEPSEDPAATVPPDRIGYVLSGDAENTIVWVLKGKVAAGAVNEDYLDVLAGVRRGELEIVLRTVDVPRHVLCRRGDLPPDLSAAVVDALLAMDEDETGRTALGAFEATTRFEPLDGGPGEFRRRLDPLLDHLQTEVVQP